VASLVEWAEQLRRLWLAGGEGVVQQGGGGRSFVQGRGGWPLVRWWQVLGGFDLKHPLFHLHFTPTNSSWMNLERRFAELTNRKLRRSAHRSLTELETDIRRLRPDRGCDPRR
jgi:hypothetical protein